MSTCTKSFNQYEHVSVNEISTSNTKHLAWKVKFLLTKTSSVNVLCQYLIPYTFVTVIATCDENLIIADTN